MFPKFHLLTHYQEFLLRFGSMVSGAGYAFEAAIRFLVRNPYRMSNKQRQGVTTAVQIMKRTEQIHSLTVALCQYHDLAIEQRLHFEVGQSLGDSIGEEAAQGATSLYCPVALGAYRRARRRTEAGAMAGSSIWGEGGHASFVGFGGVATDIPEEIPYYVAKVPHYLRTCLSFFPYLH
jgi:hypothetical protein